VIWWLIIIVDSQFPPPPLYKKDPRSTSARNSVRMVYRGGVLSPNFYGWTRSILANERITITTGK